MDFTDFTNWSEEEVVKIIRMSDEEFRDRQERESFLFALRKVPLNEISSHLDAHGFSDLETLKLQAWLCRLVNLIADNDSIEDGDGCADDDLPPNLSLVQFSDHQE